MQGMRDLLRGSLARSLRFLTEEDRLAAALPVVCGTALASHCEVERLDEERTLHLWVRGREWMGPLLSMREMLKQDLARAAGVPLSGLHFEVARPGAAGGTEPRRLPTARSSGEASEDGANGRGGRQMKRGF